MKKFVLFLACGLMIGNIVSAQTPGLKIGYINSGILLQSMPDKVTADSAVAKYARSFQEQIDIMMKEYQSKGQAYQSGEKNNDGCHEGSETERNTGSSKQDRKYTAKRTGKNTDKEAGPIHTNTGKSR